MRQTAGRSPAATPIVLLPALRQVQVVSLVRRLDLTLQGETKLAIMELTDVILRMTVMTEHPTNAQERALLQTIGS